MVRNPPTNAGDARDAVSIAGLVRFPGEGNGNPLQHSCLENSMDRGAWQATVSWDHKESDAVNTCTHSQARYPSFTFQNNPLRELL